MTVIEGTYGTWYDEVRVDGEVLNPRPSQRVFNHSPDGFAWGYHGSGPAQLALAILLKVGFSPELSLRHYQQFKREFIANLPQRGDFHLEVDIETWVLKQVL